MAKDKGRSMGAWSFLVGVILALVLGIFTAYLSPSVQSIVVALLVIVGIAVGLLNVTSKESSSFLMAGVSLVIVSFAGQSVLTANLESLGFVGEMLGKILSALLILFVPTTVIVALKSVFELARD